jgi:adenine deaminase
MMEAAGIPRAEVLRAATSEPAAAMRQSSVFGQVKRGMRADLVLLASDPTQNLNAYRDNRGVMVRGRWLDRTTLDASLAQLAAVEAEPDDQFPVTNGRVRALLRDASLLSADHIALDTMNLADASTSLRKLGYSAAAAELDSLTAATGPCVEITPHGGDD